MLFVIAIATTSGSSARAFVSPGTAMGRCPPGMVMIPGGSFTMTSTSKDYALFPFCLDRTEVTTAAYRACSKLGRCGPTPTQVNWTSITDADRAQYSKACNGDLSGRDDHPINCVDWLQATAYCASIGARLPTEEEWEWAARGGSFAYTYPWGNVEPKDQLCWSGVKVRDDTCPVGAFPEGDNPWGVHDLAGGVVEFTSSKYLLTFDEYTLRGGAWASSAPTAVAAADRYGISTTDRRAGIGFRCARNL